jgi:hypothetical protein
VACAQRYSRNISQIHKRCGTGYLAWEVFYGGWCVQFSFKLHFLSYSKSTDSVAQSYVKGQILVNEIVPRPLNSWHYTRSIRDPSIQIPSPGHRLGFAQSTIRRHAQPARLVERLTQARRTTNPSSSSSHSLCSACQMRARTSMSPMAKESAAGWAFLGNFGGQ